MKCIILLSLFFVTSLHAQSEVPPLVTNGLAAYKKSGGKEGMAVWLKGSAIENDTTTQVTITGALAQIETAYGKMTGFEEIRVVSIAPSLRRVYILGKFERGPVFFVFDCYKNESVWIIGQLDFNTKASAVLPPNILGGTK